MIHEPAPVKDRTFRDAQRHANLYGKTYAVLNLNRSGRPLYVIREAMPEPEACEVARFTPQQNEGN